MEIINQIKSDLDNPKCEGFCLDVDGNSITVRKLNKWQFDVVTENARGTENFYHKLDSQTILTWASEMLYDGCVFEYVPHIPRENTWSEEKIQKFIPRLCAEMCTTFFSGFTLTSEKGNIYTVVRDPNMITWYVDGRATDFAGAVKLTKQKLTEPYSWVYSKN